DKADFQNCREALGELSELLRTAHGQTGAVLESVWVRIKEAFIVKPISVHVCIPNGLMKYRLGCTVFVIS
ncbi:MAG: hypothetical protein JWM68_453, partial [Verrucomicrobiales bacterium]|nr:hypothetical protein [Verrucomicrobiales bacterium]